MEVKSRAEASGLPVRGIAWGVAAVLAWALYNVGAKLGVAQGFQSQDLTLMRYGVAGLLMLPLLLRGGLGSLGWGRGLMLTLCVGPLFGLVVNTGFVLAPLAHGVVLPPAATMISTTLLAWGFAGERPKLPQLIGIVILLTGLVAIAGDGLNAGTGQAVWLGDLAFIAAGTMWGTFTTLLKRWRVDAVSATAVVSVISMVVFVPDYLIIYGLPQLPAQALASQAVFQGLLGGCFGVIAYGMTVTSLGAGRAALLG
jgi:drug/metabolite transporter (DMT)-like permease